MKQQEVELNKAQGWRLCAEINLGTTLLPKNHILTLDDIRLLKKTGLQTLFCALAETGDIDFDTALGIAAAKITGQNLGFRIDERGFCEIAATADGLFETTGDRLTKFNRFSPYFILNTVAPFQLVKSGDILARLEILTPIIPQTAVDELVFSLSGNDSLLNVRDLKEQNAALLYTRFYNNDEETEQLGEMFAKLSDTYAPLKVGFTAEQTCAHTSADIAATLQELLHSAADIVFILPSLRNTSVSDVLFSAIREIADTILCPQLPLLGASDLIIAAYKNKKIIALPSTYAFIESPVLENFIKLALVKNKLQTYDFARPENSLIESHAHIKDLSLLVRGNASGKKNKANIAAVVLAAGQSKRLGKNKLLTDLGGEPLALKAIRAAIQSDASPVFVVTGYQADDLENELENFDINIVRNPNYHTGIKTSISLGLKSVPDFCDGALLIPADMPELTPDLLNKMIAKFKKKQDKQLIMAEKQGVKSNPILWSKALYNSADLVAENANMRPIFMEHSDYTVLLAASEDELLDVNFQNDLDQLRKKLKV